MGANTSNVNKIGEYNILDKKRSELIKKKYCKNNEIVIGLVLEYNEFKFLAENSQIRAKPYLIQERITKIEDLLFVKSSKKKQEILQISDISILQDDRGFSYNNYTIRNLQKVDKSAMSTKSSVYRFNFENTESVVSEQTKNLSEDQKEKLNQHTAFVNQIYKAIDRDPNLILVEDFFTIEFQCNLKYQQNVIQHVINNQFLVPDEYKIVLPQQKIQNFQNLLDIVNNELSLKNFIHEVSQMFPIMIKFINNQSNSIHRKIKGLVQDEESLVLLVNQLSEFVYENGANPDVEVILQKYINSRYNVQYKLINIGKFRKIFCKNGQNRFNFNLNIIDNQINDIIPYGIQVKNSNYSFLDQQSKFHKESTDYNMQVIVERLNLFEVSEEWKSKINKLINIIYKNMKATIFSLNFIIDEEKNIQIIDLNFKDQYKEIYEGKIDQFYQHFENALIDRQFHL